MRGGSRVLARRLQVGELMARVGSLRDPAFDWVLMGRRLHIVVILLALLVSYSAADSVTIKLGQFYINIGVT